MEQKDFVDKKELKIKPPLYRVYTSRGLVPGLFKESKLNRAIQTGSLKDVLHVEQVTSFNEAS